MKKAVILFLSVILCVTLCSYASDQSQEDKMEPASSHEQNATASFESTPGFESKQSEATPASDEPETKEIAYPYEDTEGRVRHQLYINGELVETQHAPYTYPSKPKGAFYPIVEILENMDVECLFDEHLMTLTTKINGQIVTCNANNTDIVVGKVTLGGTAPEYIDGCFYVPSYTFMQLLDATVDFTSDRSGVTMTTDMVINPDTSGVEGLSISPEAITALGEQHYPGSAACSLCGGTGRSSCTACSGTGSVTQFSQNRSLVTGQMTIQSSRAFCSRCGGSGRTTCALCGGSGKR